jgi:hypothetical protein
MENKYKIGDRVKIISMDKVRSYPKDQYGDYEIGGDIWIDAEDMDSFAGTIQEIGEVNSGNTNSLKGDPNEFNFTEEMIEGPAEAGIMGNSKTISGGDNPYFWTKQMTESAPADPVEQEGEGQEELWREVFNPPTVHGSYLKELLDKYTITRKNNPQ